MDHMFKYIRVYLILAIFFIAPFSLSAHVLEVDSEVGVLMHIDPEDSPMSGSESNIFLSFKYKDSYFSLTECKCIIEIKKEGETIKIFNKEEIKETEDTLSFAFIFPTKGTYELNISGESPTKSFQTFEQMFPITVTRESASTPLEKTKAKSLLDGHVLHFILFGGAGAIVLFTSFRSPKKPNFNSNNEKF